MRFAVAFLAGLALAAAAPAETGRPVIAPPASWVKPVAIPVDQTEAGDDAAVRFLLHDQQTMLERGVRSEYSEIAMRIQTPQGLSAGNITLPWKPDTDTLTVHKLQILREGQVIDVLANGQSFDVIRRETSLDAAMLDGVLTAVLHPEGLQVGDIVNLAATVRSTAPPLKDHVEHAVIGPWDALPVETASVRVEWPSDLDLRIRANGGLDVGKPTRDGDRTALAFTLSDTEPYRAPRGVPARYAMGRFVEMTDFGSWSQLAALMAPLYRSAAVLPTAGPLRDEVERIRAASSSNIDRAAAALALVQDRIRYIALAMGDGGLVPATAQETWTRRFGDCKGKTVLLLALLKELDIEAVPVLVNTVAGDGLDERLPMAALFDHVLVRATIDDRRRHLLAGRHAHRRQAPRPCPHSAVGLGPSPRRARRTGPDDAGRARRACGGHGHSF